ncbi:hypothetical protein CY34DRAFT_242964 [Suillus luteus UH-Slu-Lm8-n1]|uniref:Uncharacterized protein n=1 Tax=Suillus luteus UH-Slu-Lm8-n1 TaxID=930992 RepID=A0A0D0BBJ0_9AGAM|nr:hypothetical protein CY34DRAFT_242964 [Suillus luteus UH-Slu-Lm8-n1]
MSLDSAGTRQHWVRWRDRLKRATDSELLRTQRSLWCAWNFISCAHASKRGAWQGRPKTHWKAV